MLISLVLLLLCHVVCAEVVTYNWDVEDWVVDFKVPRSSRSSLFDNGKLFENCDDIHVLAKLSSIFIFFSPVFCRGQPRTLNAQLSGSRRSKFQTRTAKGPSLSMECKNGFKPRPQAASSLCQHIFYSVLSC